MIKNFKKLNTHVYEAPQKVLTPDNLYWKKLGVPVLVKEYGAIDYIDFSPVEPYHFAVTSSVRVQIYNPITKLVTKNLSRFQESAHGGTFRRDGKLLVAGDEQSFVKLFDVSTRNILRSFKGHKAAVHRTFFTSDHRIASFSDDKCVKIWDIATEKQLYSFNEHTDYIRAGCVSLTSPNILLSGGYDGIIKMYDLRTEKSVFEVKHGCPVETLLILPSDGIFISGGGTEINVYDAFMSGKLIAKISQHHKTVTCLKLASNGKRLLSSSLDRHIKIYDIATYQPVHNIDLSSPVLSMGISPHDSTLVAGMVDGLVSIYRRDAEVETEEKSIKKKKEVIQPNQSFYDNTKFDVVVEEREKEFNRKYDNYFRSYDYCKVLDFALNSATPAHKTVALIQELIRRRGLRRALANRSNIFLSKFLTFISKYIDDIRFSQVLINATSAFLAEYENKHEEFTAFLRKKIIELSSKLIMAEKLTYSCLKLQGSLELLMAASSISSKEIEIPQLEKLQPSKRANRQAVINVK